MMPRIRKLPVYLANRIAAGEVVERPASVIKELMENSLDAGARHIDIHVEAAGRRLIRVSDDGCGIHREDMPLAFDRHATSKIDTDDDLLHITSLGFRGEALPSIGAVSRMHLCSRAHDSDCGWQLVCEGSLLRGAPGMVPHKCGTTVEIRDLFYNTPARRHFLRSDRTEFAHIQAVFERLALSRFDVGFRLHHNHRSIYHLEPAADELARERRVAAVCGRAFLAHALKIDFSAAGLRLHGWIATPEFARSSTALQFFYLNGRPVRDRLITHAVRHAYGDTVYQGQHPAYVLFMEIDAGQVDVNVHPAKHEVRFREGRLVHDFISRSLRQALGGQEAPQYSESHAHDKNASLAMSLHEIAALYTANRYDADNNELVRDDSSLQLLGVVEARYAVARQGESLLLVDLHAAREQVLMAQWQAGKSDSQPLLIPETIMVLPAVADRIEDFQSNLADIGIHIDRRDHDRVVIRQLPSLLVDLSPELLMQQLGDYLLYGPDGDAAADRLMRHLISAVACIPVNSFSSESLASLLLELATTVDGAAAVLPLDAAQLAQLFSRS